MKFVVAVEGVERSCWGKGEWRRGQVLAGECRGEVGVHWFAQWTAMLVPTWTSGLVAG